MAFIIDSPFYDNSSITTYKRNLAECPCINPSYPTWWFVVAHLVSSTYFFSVIFPAYLAIVCSWAYSYGGFPVDIATAWLKASYFLSLAWVQCGIFWCRRILFSPREFWTITFEKKSHKVEFYKILLNRGYFGNFYFIRTVCILLIIFPFNARRRSIV